jgi:asparagine synthase (glutamine-hydrolysing)
MCAISGSAAGGERASTMLGAMRHRGPDESRVVHHGAFALGLARLAIVGVDVEAARQPLVSGAGRVLAFNGELYNVRALVPHAPSEVRGLCTLLDQGIDPRAVLDADYAIASWEPGPGRLTLWRDRFGVMPLYYQTTPCVEVSSERRRLANPRPVPPHGRVVIDVRRRRVLRREQWPLYGATADRPAHLECVARSVEDAVEGRAQHSDRGWSLALSGGLDSTLIAYAAAWRGLTPRQCVHVTMADESDSEELSCARATAARLGFPLRVVQVTKAEVRAEEGKIIEHLDGVPVRGNPVRWRGAVRNWFSAMHAGCRVMLSGEGADELLAGYPSHWRRGEAQGAVGAKCLSTLRSMPSINLDRTNKLGMAHGVEFRVPLLATSLSDLLLAQRKSADKALFRDLLLHHYKAPAATIAARKYGAAEAALQRTLPQLAPA